MEKRAEQISPDPIAHEPDPYWSEPVSALMKRLDAPETGLTQTVAEDRLKKFGPNSLEQVKRYGALKLLFAQFRNPLVLVLIFAAFISAAVGEHDEATIIILIVLASCLLGFSQEYGASKAMAALRNQISRRATVLRNGKEMTVPAETIVAGDILSLSAGNLIAVDGIIIDAKDFNVSESILTGESYPVVKTSGVSPIGASLSKRNNMVFAGTSVRSGTAHVLSVKTGAGTEFAKIAGAVEGQLPETDFARGIRQFGILMTRVMLVIVLAVFVGNLILHKPMIDSLLFSLALAVGLTPELLPAIISITLARGARALAKNGVIVRRLEAIENLGSMDLLCTDKTGTLTEGTIKLDGWNGVDGKPSDDVLLWARLNAMLQTGLKNPMDEAIAGWVGTAPDGSGYAKIEEIPYDFIRKRLSVIVRTPKGSDDYLMICKGAIQNILQVCTRIQDGDKVVALDDQWKKAIDDRFRGWSEEGFRVLGVARKTTDKAKDYSRDDEVGMIFSGFLLFLDPAKKDVEDTLKALHQRGISIKVITGDNRYVAKHLAKSVGLNCDAIMTGEDIGKLTRDALMARAKRTDLFVEIDPNQKDRIIEALRRGGYTVGYMGDGINDAPALHSADVGISVDTAVDVAREAADIVLLKQDLAVLLRGIDDGRRTFTNTMKYISIATSGNFGNMISMALASLYLPFLPALAKQILLNNFLSDLPCLAIATDNVEKEDIARPRHWDLAYVRTFMLIFGLVSSLFDFITFAFLLYVVKADAITFQTAWFIESFITELCVVLVLRTQRPFWTSMPGNILLGLSLLVGVLAIAIPYLPFAATFGFIPLPMWILASLAGITLLYLVAVEASKHLFRWIVARKTPKKRQVLRHTART